MKALRRTLALVFLILPMTALAQSFTTTQVSATHLVDTNKQPLTGTVVITLTDSNNNPVTYTPQGGSPSTAPFTANVTKGVIQPVAGFPYAVPAAATTTPAGILYRIQTINSNSVVVWTLPLTPFTGPTFSIDGYIAQAGTPISGTGPPTLPHCASGAEWTDTNYPAVPYACSRTALGDQTTVWTQNPSQNQMCPSGAIAYPFATPPYCIPATIAYLLPNYVLGDNLAIPAPAVGIPNTGGGGFMAGEDLSGTNTAQEVIGILGHTLPSLATGYLQWNGTAWAFGAGGSVGGGGTGQCLPIWTGSGSSTTLGTSPLCYDSTGLDTLTATAIDQINLVSPVIHFQGAGGVAAGSEMTQGSSDLVCTAGVDCAWASSSTNALMMNNNGTGNQYIVGATGLTAGYFPIASAPGSIVNSLMDQDHTTSGQITIGSGEGLTANQVIVSPLCTATSGANCNSSDLFIQSSGWDTGVAVSTTNAGSGYTPGTVYTPTITGETCTINPTPYAIGNLTGQLLVNVTPGFNCTVAGTITAPAPSSGTTWTGTLALTNAAQTDAWLNFLGYGTDATGFHSINGIYAPTHPSYPNAPVFGIVQAPEQGLMRGYLFDIDAPVGATATLSGSELSTARTYKVPDASGDIATFVHGVPNNNDCAKWLVSGSTATLGDAGAACGSGGGVTGGACPAGQFTISINTSGVPTCALPSRIVDVQARYPASSGYATLGAKIIAAATDATIPCYAVFDATNGVAVDTGIGSSWSISGGNLSIVMPNQTGAVADQVLLTFASTSSLTGVYTIGSTTTSSTLVVPTASGLSSGTETVTMQPLSGTADIIIAKSCPQALKVPSLGVMKMNTAAATNATPSAPSVATTTGSLPAGTYYSTYKIKTASGRSLASAVTTTTLGSTGGLTFTSPSCGSDGESYNIYIGTSATAGSHVLQANQVCGQPFTFNLANLYPNEETDSAVSTPNPAIQLWNVNHGQLYADSGNNAGFEFQTYSTYAAGDIVAALGFGYTTEQRFTATNTAAITLGTDTANPTVGPASCYEEGIFWASLHKDVNCWGAGGTSTLPAFGEKTIGPMNDLVFDGYAPTCGGNYCYPGWIQRVPYIDGNSQGMHDITFKGTAPQTYSSSTYPPISVIGIPFGGNTAIPGGGIYSLAFEGLSLEGTANQGGYQFTDATSIQIKGGSVKIGATFGFGNAYSCVKIDTTIGSSNTWAGASNISWDHPVCTNANYEFLNDVDTGASVPTSAASTNTYAMTNPQDFGNAPNAAVGAAYFNDRNWNLHNSEILSDTGIVLGSPTGGYEGAGTINMTGCFVNGVACSTGGGLPTGTIGQTLYYAAGGTTGTATSAITESSSGTSGALAFGGTEYHAGTGPTTQSTLTTAITNSTTTIPFTTAGYATPSTSAPVALILSNSNHNSEIVLCTAYTSSSMTCARSQAGTTAQAWEISPTTTVSEISFAVAAPSGAPWPIFQMWNGPTWIGAGSGFSPANTGALFGSSGLYSEENPIYLRQIGFRDSSAAIDAFNSGSGYGINLNNSNYFVDGTGTTSAANGTQAITTSTTSLTPSSGVLVLTGTAIPASGNVVTLVPNSALASCSVTTSVSCSVEIVNTDSGGAITTGSGTSANNFATVTTFPPNQPIDCVAYGSTRLWYCSPSGGGGAVFTANAIQYATSTTASRAATAVDISNTSFGTDSGTTNTYVVSTTPSFSSLSPGLTVRFLALNANTNNDPTVNVNGTGVVQIVDPNGVNNLSVGDINTTSYSNITYNGTYFVLNNPNATNVVQQPTSDQTITAGVNNLVPLIVRGSNIADAFRVYSNGIETLWVDSSSSVHMNGTTYFQGGSLQINGGGSGCCEIVANGMTLSGGGGQLYLTATASQGIAELVTVHSASAAPTASAGTITGSNAGGFISGLSAATSVTITFANSGWNSWAACTATPSVTGISVYNSSQSTTAVTFSFAALTGTLYYTCTGN